MTNASILSILAHATPTPTSRSKGQKSKSRGGGILWWPPSRTACYLCDCVTLLFDWQTVTMLLLSALKLHTKVFLTTHSALTAVCALLQSLLLLSVQFYAMHGQNIHLPVCVCVSVTLSVNSPTGQTPQCIFTVDSLKDTDLRKDVPFGGLDDE